MRFNRKISDKNNPTAIEVLSAVAKKLLWCRVFGSAISRIQCSTLLIQFPLFLSQLVIRDIKI